MKELDNLVKIIRTLRSPKGCPWDRAQGIKDYKKFLLEETYELIDEISQNKTEAIEEELGDLFLILIIITEMLNEKGKLSLESVLSKINKKLIVRHPHVFSSAKLKTEKAVLAYWIKNKAKHKKRKTIKDRLPQTAPSLLLADLFFKEYAHTDKGKNKITKKEVSLNIKEIIKKLKFYQDSKNKEKLLSEINFDICKIASLCHLDLENLLRQKVFKEAGSTFY